MVKVNCGGFYIDEKTLKVIDGVLTNKDAIEITDIITDIKPYCGQLKIDGTVFKLDKDKNKNNCITLKTTESITDSFTPCQGARFDSAVFEIKNQILSLKSGVQTMSINAIETEYKDVPMTKVTFESLDDFTIIVKDESGKVLKPIEDKIYQLERTKPYTYEATNSNQEVSNGNITTTSRQANVTKTIEF